MRIEQIEAEFRGAEFGDKRRGERLERIGATIAREPGLSFPEAMASEGQLEALYRFLNNDAVNFSSIHHPHARQTVERCRAHEEIFVLHDTTALAFGGDRSGLGRLQTKAEGFFLHTSLAVTADRTPLGILGAEPWVRTTRARGRRNRRHLRKDPERESLRWWRGVARCEEMLGASRHAVHIMDREGDNYDLFAQMSAESVRYVIRLAHNRRLVGETEKLKEFASKGRCIFKREVRLAARAQALPYDQRIHPARDVREASLSVSAVSVELRRSNNYAPESPPSLQVNVVTVKELDCPEGVEPICWHLVTNEPIDTRAQVAFIVDAYRSRWIVEELFKALKTGCRFERRQLESYHSLSNALAIFLPIAVRLLALRSAARAEPGAPSTILSQRQVQLLRLYTTRPLGARQSNEQVCLALAEFGGHLRSNGPPGWIVLGRALERLLLLELGWVARENTNKDVIDD
jgi:Transposase DNA-binding/Transposase DDE domain